jgi:iron complex outermembrane receptor protein
MIRGRPAWGLDEILGLVPGVFVANRHNFSVDQRVAIRGFGARSAFATRGVKVLLDGIPLTLPDGQGQLTAVELGSAARVEVLNGSAASLFGNAAGGVIEITSPATAAAPPFESRLLAGAFDRRARRGWIKWQGGLAARLGSGYGALRASRLVYAGERDHTDADLRTVSARVTMPLSEEWTLTALGDGGDTPRADNPGALTAAELALDRDAAAGLNVSRRAGKGVRQYQGGLSLRGRLHQADIAVTTFAISRNLENPLPQAFILLDRRAWGARASASLPARVAGRELRLTTGLDLQWQRDDRREHDYLVPNAALTEPDNTPGVLARSQLERVRELGPFARATFALSRAVSIAAGVRHDRVRFAVSDRYLQDGLDNSGARTFAATSGSAGVALAAHGGVTLYANVASSFETPTTTELNNQPPPGGGGFNPDLEPQRAVTVELGARQRQGDVRWSVAAFSAGVRDQLVAFEDTAVAGRRFFRNAANARHQGLELGAEARLRPGLEVALAWTVSRFLYTSHRVGAIDVSGRAIPGIPRHSLRGTARVEPGWPPGGWIALEVGHASSVSVDDTLDVRAGGWWQADVRAGWTGTVGSWLLEPFLAINNAFNAHYVSSVVINAARGRYYEPGPGRHALIGVALKPALPRRSSPM